MPLPTDYRTRNISNPISAKPDTIHEPLHVITPIIDPWRYWSRWELYHDFAERMKHANAVLTPVEVAYGERSWTVTAADLEGAHLNKCVQLRTEHELWHKENAINIGFQNLPKDWKYAAWIDADVAFARPDIVDATIHMLQHFDIVQMWSQGLDLDPQGHSFAQYQSFCHSYLNSLVPSKGGKSGKLKMPPSYGGYGSGPGAYWHSGYAWAIRRDAFDTIGGLLDNSILGAADYFMAWALVGMLQERIYYQLPDKERCKIGYNPDYTNALLLWQRNALQLRKNIGCVEGTLLHYWHGKKRQRGYNTRENILIDTQFSPAKDLRRDWQGLYQLHDDGSERSVMLRDQVRAYFRARNEDSIDP